MFRAGSIGTEVNNAETSKEQRYSPGRRVTSLTLLTKSLVLYMWCGDLPTNGFSTLARTLATPYVTDPLLDTMGLREVPVLWILGNPYNLGGVQPIGYMVLYVPYSLFIPLSVVMIFLTPLALK